MKLFIILLFVFITKLFCADTIDLNSEWSLAVDEEISEKNITLPHYINNKFDQAVYSNKFQLKDVNSNKNLRLYLNGIKGKNSIFINNNFITEHSRIPSPYTFDISNQLLQEGVNTVDILIDGGNSFKNDIPYFKEIFDKKNYHGISGPVLIKLLPEVIMTSFNYGLNNNVFKLSYEIEHTKKSFQKNSYLIEEKIFDSDNKILYRKLTRLTFPQSRRVINRSINVGSASKWNAESPKLYNISWKISRNDTLIYDKITKIGFRKLNLNSGDIFINNEKLIIKGITYRINDLSPSENFRDDFITIKQLGFNTIRFTDDIPGQQMLAFLDSLGLYIFLDSEFKHIPGYYFEEDYILQIAKLTSDEILSSLDVHPSFIGYGIGDGIDLNSISVQKFYLILKEYIKQKYHVFVYMKPLTTSFDTEIKLSDLYLINYQKGFFRETEDQPLAEQNPVLIGNFSYPASQLEIEEKIKAEKLQLYNFVQFYNNMSFEKTDGFFIESYRDWKATVPTTFATADSYYPYGIFNNEGEPRLILQYLDDLNSGKMIELNEPKSRQNYNFFNLIVFIVSIIFFLFYKRNIRFRDNLIRSLKHPHGFFVDLRDGRIISLSNATIMLIFTALIFSAFISAFFYLHRDSVILEEIVTIVLPLNELKSIYVTAARSPWQMYIIVFLILVIMQYLFGLFLKLFSLLTKTKARLKQTIAIMNWSGSPLIFFVPFSLFSYNIMLNNFYQSYLFLIFAFFVLWYNFRLMNGIRVLFMVRPLIMTVLLSVTYITIICAFYLALGLNIHSVRYLILLIQTYI